MEGNLIWEVGEACVPLSRNKIGILPPFLSHRQTQRKRERRSEKNPEELRRFRTFQSSIDFESLKSED
ncbi:hypothetical protein CKAN_00430200 [Cinnamomum micranthum f. kanehirae]|uniref:Uncharacterized protein n=1 Tax=Cinnamomum micranthum f. kanehirae TaxID=337451 RepID=A0A3S3PZN5_9MAGN|nr:hypothetical protein CKAN_00430200 [Cinnamomum micranthum f. kanehirae]